jgi:hypothetical protein
MVNFELDNIEGRTTRQRGDKSGEHGRRSARAGSLIAAGSLTAARSRAMNTKSTLVDSKSAKGFESASANFVSLVGDFESPACTRARVQYPARPRSLAVLPVIPSFTGTDRT